MKTTITRMLLVVGTLIGLFGVVVLYSAALMLPWAISDLMGIVPTAFRFGLAAYLIYVAYLVWFQPSPRSVQHICGAVGCFVVILIIRIFGTSGPSSFGLALLVSLALVYPSYRVLTQRLSRLLFPDTEASN